MSVDISLYVHFPFCRRKCNYCSFVSYQGREADIPEYIEALKWELSLRAAGQRVNTIYFGGGTPSLLSIEQVGEVLSAIHSFFDVDKEAEVTIEANVGTVDETYLTGIRALGINRLSLGVQSLREDELVMLGRIHTAEDARAAVRFARSAGFANLNLDFLYGLPGVCTDSWRRTLAGVVELDAEHLSLYALTIDRRVLLGRAIEVGNLPAIDSDSVADQYELAEDLLQEVGWHHYEISNWAKHGRECRHNIVYWQTLPYMGVGVAAHSYMDGHRFANVADVDRYLESFSCNVPLVYDLDEEIDQDLQVSEAIILGLRMNEGIDVEDFQSRFDVELPGLYGQQIDELTNWGLLEYGEGHLRLTRRGRLLGNEVFWRLLPK